MSKFKLFVNAYILNTCFPGLQKLEQVGIKYNDYLLFLQQDMYYAIRIYI